MERIFLSARERERWDAFVASSPYGHVLQAWEWGDIKEAGAWRAYRMGLQEHGDLVAGAQILVRSLPYGAGRLAYVPKGPVVDYSNESALRTVIAALRAFAAEQGVIALKIEPEVTEPSPLPAQLLELGLRPALPVQMRSTIWVSLAGTEEEIMARQKQKTRYNIRLAAKKGVRIEHTGADGLPEWYRMYRVTAERDGFTVHSEAYYRDVLETLVPRGMASLLLARHEGDLLAGIIAFRFSRFGQYMYGASSNVKRNLMAPYLVQWEGMRWAREGGAACYDLWGIPDRLEENEDLWGVYRHKRGYGGEIVRYVGAYDLVQSPLRHAALERVARPLFKRVARLSTAQPE